jgi:cephalosporin hydroxylase
MNKELSRELITENPQIAQYLPIGEQVRATIDGRVCHIRALPFLALIADLMREAFPRRFTYLETGTLFGGSLCALSFHMKRSEIEKYAGIDRFDYYGQESDPSSGVEVSIERADRNVRYFGVKDFALFEGDSHSPQIAKRSLAYLRDAVTMLFIDADHTADGCLHDFETFAPAVVPGGVVVFDDYHNQDWPGVTKAVDVLAARFADEPGWIDVGPLIETGQPTLYVLQRERAQ